MEPETSIMQKNKIDDGETVVIMGIKSQSAQPAETVSEIFRRVNTIFTRLCYSRQLNEMPGIFNAMHKRTWAISYPP